MIKKTSFLFILSLMMLVPLNAQRDEQSLYQHKIKSYSRMSAAGWTMTGLGGGLAITGGLILASLPRDYWNDYDNYNDDFYDELDNDIKALSGFVCIGVGVGMLTGGIIIGSIGTRKLHFYREKLDKLSLAPVLTPKMQGLSLVYRF